LTKIEVPPDLDDVLNDAWEAAQKVPGHLFEDEARFLGTVVACAPSTGAIVEIGSFKGKSTVMIAKVAKHYGLGPIVAIDPHNSPKLLDTHADPAASSYQDFLNNLEAAGYPIKWSPFARIRLKCSVRGTAPSGFYGSTVIIPMPAPKQISMAFSHT
jgi:hypothetical protein